MGELGLERGKVRGRGGGVIRKAKTEIDVFGRIDLGVD